MTDKGIPGDNEAPFLYYKTKENIEGYRKKPVFLKLRWLQARRGCRDFTADF